jgi:hypothetical protein
MSRIYKYLTDAVGIAMAAGVASILLSVIGGNLRKYAEMLLGVAVLCALVAPIVSSVKFDFNVGDSKIPTVVSYQYDTWESVVLKRVCESAEQSASELVRQTFMLDEKDFEISVRAELDGEELRIVSAELVCDGIKRRKVREYLSRVLDCEVEYG